MYIGGGAQVVCKWALFHGSLLSLRTLEPVSQGREEITILT